MSTFTATGEAFACGITSTIEVVNYDYAEGSEVYPIAKAKKGDLERLIIKKVYVIDNRGLNDIVYVDTLNGAWKQEELCVKSDAVDYAIAYLENQKALLEIELTKCP